MDQMITLAEQLKSERGLAILSNTFVVRPGGAERFMAHWSADVAIMKAQPGFISTQLRRGVAGSSTFLNYAVWQLVAHFRAAFVNPEFRARSDECSEDATVSPHLFRRVEVPGTCVA